MNQQAAAEVARTVREVGELKLKIAALEEILANERPALYASYIQGFDDLRRSKAHETFLKPLGNLPSRLQGR